MIEFDEKSGRTRLVFPLPNAKFQVGHIVTTPLAQTAVKFEDAMECIARHAQGDWGECCPEDARRNEEALVNGDRLFSVFRTFSGRKFWIITEADRSVTTILLPEEY